MRAAGALALTVTNCSDASDFRTKLSTLQSGGGGTLTFNCGTATLALSSTLVIGATITTDGGSKITLSAAHKGRLFYVTPGAGLTLKNIRLEDDYINDYGTAIYNGNLILDHATLRQGQTYAWQVIVLNNMGKTKSDW